jgi:hypothetical protein
MSVDRFKNASTPCPICGGNDRADRAGGNRCGGFLSDDGKYAHCTSSTHAGGLHRSGSGCYAHLLQGRCLCGETHNPAPTPISIAKIFPGAAAPEPTRKLVRTYDYLDERGKLLYQVCRYEPKGFSQRRPGNFPDEWIYNLKDTRRVLYRLPELIASSPVLPVFIPEGEKDVDNLIQAGLIATTNPQGAGKWLPEYNLALKGRHVALLPDNDEPGREHAEKVAAQLHGIATSVTIIHLPGLPPKGDVSDWLKVNSQPADKLFALLETTPIYNPAPDLPPTEEGAFQDVLSGIISASDLMKKEFEPIRWVIPELLPEGLGLCAGRPKMGKSWLWLHFAMAVAAGGCALSSIDLGGQPAEVLYLALEDNQRRLQDRTRKLCEGGSAPAGLHLHTEWPRIGEGCELALESWLIKHPAARLVVIDTLAKIKVSAPRNQGIYDSEYNLTQGLKILADKYRVALVVLHHTRKALAEDALEEISGSFGISAGVDTLLVLKRLRGDADAVLEVIGRDMPENKELALQWEQERASWRLMGNAPEYEGSKQRREILSLLQENQDGMSAKEIADHLSKNWEATRRLLYELKKSGYIDGSDRGKVKISPMGTASL